MLIRNDLALLHRDSYRIKKGEKESGAKDQVAVKAIAEGEQFYYCFKTGKMPLPRSLGRVASLVKRLV